MTPLSIVLIAICAAVTAVAAAMTVRTVTRMVRTIRLGQPDPTRSGSPGRRLGTMLAETVGHTRMLQWSVIGVAHWFVFAGFIVLSVLVAEAYGEVIDPSFEFWGLGSFGPWNLLVEILAVLTIVGIAVLIVIRQRAHPRHPRRRSRFAGSNFWQAYFVEIVVAIEGVGVLLVRGFKQSADYLHQPVWSSPVAHWLGSFLPSSDAAIQITALFKVLSAMVWLIVIAANITMGVAWHRFTVWPNIFFKREGDGSTALGALKPMMSGGAPLDFEKADPETDVFGAGKIEDFSWKAWLDFTTCTECGRCQSQCPAWNTAKPLSPKLVILALRDHAYAKAPYLAAGGGKDMAGTEKLSDEDLAALAHSDPLAALEAGRPLVGDAESGGIIDPEVLWDCTTCGACVQQCPVDIEHVDHIVDMRRYQVMIESEFPTELGGLFRNLENKGNPWGQNASARMDWAKDLPFEVPVVNGTIDRDHEYLFWIGCAGAFDDRARRTVRATAELLHLAAVGFAVLGTAETCTGDPARRAGNEFLFQMLAQQNVETINAAFGERKRRKIVTTCAHCFNTLFNEYPSLGGQYEVVHHTQLLNRLVRERRLVPVADPARASRQVTYHDPCYLGRHNQVYSPPRELIGASGVTLAEMPRNSERALCCGAGGARMWMEERIGKRINLERTDEALDTGATQIVTACPFCRVMLSDGLTARQADGAGSDVEVLDVAQVLLDGVKRG
ncbi:MAG TPA: (Fe-S)-binding protein [Nakamurella sp.]|nr:(Fe-S)-binding protein [Nakamurella sp.]